MIAFINVGIWRHGHNNVLNVSMISDKVKKNWTHMFICNKIITTL